MWNWVHWNDIADFTASAINHIINIVKYGSTAVITEDVGDVVEAWKLFLNIDLASGIIKKHQGGYEFEIEQGIKCRKYVCGTEELLYIWKEIYSTEILNKTKRKNWACTRRTYLES